MRRTLRIIIRGLAAIAALAVLALLATWLTARGRLPRLDGIVAVDGLATQATIRRDERGVPHIDAAGLADAATAIGFAHAQDRFFQMDLARRAAGGRLSEIVGPAALALDRKNRTLGLEATARRDLDADAGTRALLEAYARGVNAGLRDTGRPLECLLLRYTPEPWTPLDSLLVLKYMEDMLTSDGGERERARASEKLGLELAEYLGDFQGLVGATILADGGESEQGPVPASGSEPGPESRPGTGAGGGGEKGPVPGSNAWVIAGAHTKSGKPLLANDPHLPVGVPGIFYQAQLRFVDAERGQEPVDVVGMTIPGLPLVVIGHNGRVAWGMTTLVADQVDWVTLELAKDGRSFRGPDGWEPVERREETIAVKGGASETLVVRWTRFGPIVEDRGDRALARDWTAYHTAGTLEAVLGFARARDTSEFLAAAHRFTSPGQNLLAADTEGHIAWFPGAAIPLRRDGDGRLPRAATAPAAGIPELVATDDFPTLFDPPAGAIVTANNRIGVGPSAMRISTDWAPPFRADRIVELLAERHDHDRDSMAAIQGDARSRLARDVVAVLPPGPFRDAATERWRARLAAWDGSFVAGPEPALFEHFWRELRRALFEDDAGPLWQDAELGALKAIGAREFRGVPPALAARDFFDDLRSDGNETRDEIVARALAAAIARMREDWGSDEAAWGWERIHRAALDHPLGGVPLLGRLLNLPPRPVRGSSHTVCVNAGRATNRFRATHAAAGRLIFDLADLAASRAVIATGQSGHPLSRHYGDQAAAWARLESFPMWYREADIVDHTRATLTLRPGSARE